MFKLHRLFLKDLHQPIRKDLIIIFNMTKIKLMFSLVMVSYFIIFYLYAFIYYMF